MTIRIIDPKTIVLQFNDCINNRDLDSLVELMTDDHRFIDTEENQVTGKQSCKMAWHGFFTSFPDYQNNFEIVTSKDNIVTIQGYSHCSDKRLEGKAIWTAKILNNKVAEWRVYVDTADNRRELNLLI